jgi:tetratricopeptide (TPR) repeat protein
VALQISANMLRNAGRFEEALLAVEEGAALAEDRLRERRDDAPTLQNAALLRAARILVHECLGSAADELQELEEREGIVELLAEARELDPEDRRLRADLALESGNLALCLSRAGEHGEALEVSGGAIEGLRALVRDFPSIQGYGELLIERLGNHGMLLTAAGREEQGTALLEEQADLAEALFLQQRGRVDSAERAALVLNNLGVNQVHFQGRMERALETVVRAERALDEALRLEPNKPSLLLLRGLIAYNRTLATLALDRREAARAALGAYESAAPVGLQGLVLGADLWAEWVQCLARTQPLEPDLEAQGRARCLDLLEEAVRAGFRDRDLLAEASLFGEVLAAEPRWRALLADLDESGGM